MKILFVINGLNRGGAERMLLRLLRSSTFSDDQLTVVSLLGPGDLSPEVEHLGHNLIHLHLEKTPLGLLRLFKLIGIIRSLKPHVIHSWLYQADLITGICASILRFKPLIWSIRVQGVTNSSHNKFLTRLCIKLCAVLSFKVPFAIVSNAHASRDTHRRLGYDGRKIEVIPNGVDTTLFFPSQQLGKAMRKSVGIAEKAPVVLMVSRFDKQKNLEGFFTVARKIIANIPTVKFLLCGRGMDSGNLELMDMVREFNIQPSVHLLGLRDNVTEVFNAGNVLVSASYEEGWPNVIGEAMACGVPCVATDVGDTARIIEKAGRVVPSGDLEQLTQQTLSILRLTSQQRELLSQEVRQQIETNFDIKKVAPEFRRLYESAIRSDWGKK